MDALQLADNDGEHIHLKKFRNSKMIDATYRNELTILNQLPLRP